MSTSTHRWHQVKSIFSDAVELKDQARADYLDQACGADEDLRHEVEKLLNQVPDESMGSNLLPSVAQPEPPPPTLQPQDVVAARYRILRLAGRGGMGEVYEAQDDELGGRVALKLLRADLAHDPEFVARFRREVQLARQVTHPNICRVFDVGRDGDRVFLTMEFLAGDTLTAYLRTRRSLLPSAALPIIRQLAEGLDALHERSIVHRDFKPGNIIIAGGPGVERAIISDFGLARAIETSAPGAEISQASQLLGTPDYMSPEQFLGHKATPASDVYAFGLVIYEMISGKRGFTVSDRPISGLGEPWDTVLRRCVSSVPAERPSALEVYTLLTSPAAVETTATISQPPEMESPAQSVQMWGPFRLLERVGQGGFGEVYRAWDSSLEREVAVKLLSAKPGGQSMDEAFETIVREARSMARLRHPNIVTVYGVDRHGGRVGFWSDFVKGKTLTELLRDQGHFGARETALIGIELCRALGAVHAAGLLHRDIKAGNVMREAGGRILLLDFGLTQVPGHEPMGGTPAYMAPELFGGAPATIGTDVYALGVLLFHLLTGKYPVNGTNWRKIRAAHESNARRILINERPDLPEPFVRVVETAIDADHRKRYASAGHMLSALSEALGAATPVPVIVAPPKRRASWLAIPVAAALFAGAWFAYPLLNRSNTESTASSTSEEYLQAKQLVEHFYKKGNLESAIERFERILQRDPKSALGHAGLGRACWLKYRVTRDKAMLERARTASTAALQLDSQLAPAHVTLGSLYAESGNLELAASELNQAIRLDARSAEAYGALADLYSRQGRVDEIEPTLQKAADLGPSDWRWANELGLRYLKVRKLPLATEQFQRMIQLTPDSAPAYNNLGVVYLNLDKFDEAGEAFRKALSLQPDPRYYSNMAQVHKLQLNHAEAAKILRTVVESNPSDYASWGNLASAYRQLPGSDKLAREASQKVIEIASKASEVRPNDAALLTTLGDAHANLGNTAACVPLLRQAVAIEPDNPDILYRAGTAYELIHRRREAIDLIAKALTLGYSRERFRRNPELKDLRLDPQFAIASKSTMR